MTKTTTTYGPHELRYENYVVGFIWFCSCGEKWQHPQLVIKCAQADAREHIGKKEAR